jgi:hypothetical protein
MNLEESIFDCLVALPRKNGGWAWFGIGDVVRMSVSEDAITIKRRRLTWDSLKEIKLQGRRISISNSDGRLEFLVLNPLTGVMDPSFASLVAQFMCARQSGDARRAANALEKICRYCRVVDYVKLAVVLAPFVVGILISFNPAQIGAALYVCVPLAVGLAFFPSLYANWAVKSEKGPDSLH